MINVLKVLRDTKLNDDTSIRLSVLNNETEVDISVTKGETLSRIVIPNDGKVIGFELLMMAYELLPENVQGSLSKFLGKSSTYDEEKENYRHDSESLEAANMWINEQGVPTHNDMGDQYSIVGRITQLLKLQQQDLQNK